jgi:DNA-3-methyladenine glycosylase
MYGPPGHAYVYFIYGNHWCFNAVCRPGGVAEAVLIRAIEPTFGLERMRARRRAVEPKELTNGPAKCCAALDIDRAFDGVDLCDSASPIVLARNPTLGELTRSLGPLVTTTRIGLTKAADWPLRFCLAGSRFVSRGVVGLTAKSKERPSRHRRDDQGESPRPPWKKSSWD